MVDFREATHQGDAYAWPLLLLLGFSLLLSGCGAGYPLAERQQRGALSEDGELSLERLEHWERSLQSAPRELLLRWAEGQHTPGHKRAFTAHQLRLFQGLARLALISHALERWALSIS